MDALTSLVATPANAETTKRTKTFTYTISEVNDGKAGYEYDGHDETVKVTVTDEGDGKLSVVTTYDEDGAVFNNSYTVSGETGDSVKATKKLTGRDPWLWCKEPNIGMEFAYHDLHKELGLFLEVYNEEKHGGIPANFKLPEED